MKPSDLPLLSGIVYEDETRREKRMALFIFLLAFSAVGATATARRGILLTLLFLACFMAVWIIVTIIRNVIARKTGVVLPWSFNDLFWGDAYFDPKTRKKYKLRKAEAGVSFLFLVIVFILFVFLLTYVIPDPWA